MDEEFKDKDIELAKTALNHCWEQIKSRADVEIRHTLWLSTIGAIIAGAVLGYGQSINSIVIRIALFVFLVFFAIVLWYRSFKYTYHNHKTYNDVARTIVKINKRLGCFDKNILPANWKKWGKAGDIYKTDFIKKSKEPYFKWFFMLNWVKNFIDKRKLKVSEGFFYGSLLNICFNTFIWFLVIISSLTLLFGSCGKNSKKECSAKILEMDKRPYTEVYKHRG